MRAFLSRLTRNRACPAAILLLAFLPSARAQPTYKLDVKPHLDPLATLTLKDGKLTRSAVKDDPGFRLQYHFRQAGMTLAVVEARSNPTLAIPQKAAGIYHVVLELFYPAYKGGTQQKGEFRPISNTVAYRVEPGAKPADPVKVTAVEPPRPALVVHCGKGGGKQQDGTVAANYAYKLLQGMPQDAWPKTAPRTHCWTDPRLVRFELTVPPGTAGTLRLLLVDGDNRGRKERVVVQGKVLGEVEAFPAGRLVRIPLPAADTKTGKIDVQLQAVNPMASAVVSAVEFVPEK